MIRHLTEWPLALAAALALCGAVGAATPEEAMNKAGCTACPSKHNTLVGPSFTDTAAKYHGKAAAAPPVEKVRPGGAGTFGPIAMSPNGPDSIGDADLKAAVLLIPRS